MGSLKDEELETDQQLYLLGNTQCCAQQHDTKQSRFLSCLVQAPKSPVPDRHVQVLLVVERASWKQGSRDISSQTEAQSLPHPLVKDIDLVSVTRQCKQGNDALKRLTRLGHQISSTHLTEAEVFGHALK